MQVESHNPGDGQTLSRLDGVRRVAVAFETGTGSGSGRRSSGTRPP